LLQYSFFTDSDAGLYFRDGKFKRRLAEQYRD